MGTVTSRLSELIEIEGISVIQFEKKIGCGVDSIGKAIRNNTTIGDKLLQKVFSAYPEINPDWLMTGKGKMLRSEKKDASENTEFLRKELAEKDKKIQELQDQIIKMLMEKK
jgi:hypothetical protein